MYGRQAGALSYGLRTVADRPRSLLAGEEVWTICLLHVDAGRRATAGAATATGTAALWQSSSAVRAVGASKPPTLASFALAVLVTLHLGTATGYINHWVRRVMDSIVD